MLLFLLKLILLLKKVNKDLNSLFFSNSLHRGEKENETELEIA